MVERLRLTPVVVITATPLQAAGLLAALSGVADWQVVAHAFNQPLPDHIAALVLQGAEPTTLPPLLPLVRLADDTGEGLLPQNRHDTRPLALLPSGASAAQLRAALAAVLQGLSVREPTRPFANPWATADAGDHEPLTPRELEVYELVGKGLSNRDIGGVLGISAHTAKFHVGQILAKVGAATRAEAVSAGLRMGLIGL